MKAKISLDRKFGGSLLNHDEEMNSSGTVIDLTVCVVVAIAMY